jgi:hypothetical protein
MIRYQQRRRHNWFELIYPLRGHWDDTKLIRLLKVPGDVRRMYERQFRARRRFRSHILGWR